MNETSLYAPVKRFLESLGFVVKGEIGGCDIVALREAEPPVVVIWVSVGSGSAARAGAA